MIEPQHFDQLPLGSRVACQTSDISAFKTLTGLGFDYDGSVLQGVDGEYVLSRSRYALAAVDDLPQPLFQVRILSS